MATFATTEDCLRAWRGAVSVGCSHSVFIGFEDQCELYVSSCHGNSVRSNDVETDDYLDFKKNFVKSICRNLKRESPHTVSWRGSQRALGLF